MASVNEALSVFRVGHRGADALDIYWECARVIGRSQTRTATRNLIRAVLGTDESIRREAALHALWQLDDRRAVSLFLRVAGNPEGAESEAARIIAVEALGVGIGRSNVQHAVARYLRDPSKMVRFSALCAAGRLCHLPRAPITDELRHSLEETAKDPTTVYEPGDVARLAIEILNRCAIHRDRGERHASLRVWKSPPSAPRA